MYMDDFPRFHLDDEESKERTEEEGSRLEEIAGPHLLGMIVEERFPVLSTGSFWANLLHILLNSPFTDPNIQFEGFPADALRSPKPIVCRHLLDQGNRLWREPRLSRARLRCVFPEHDASAEVSPAG